MELETKQCANCQQQFTIEPEDFAFYQKIDVPPPTWCPECRFMRRMAWRNEWRLFRKKSAHGGKEIFSLFSPESYQPVYENDYWFSDAWDPMESGKDYDFSKPFFTQIRELLERVPMTAQVLLSSVNSDFCVNASYLKNCYFVASSDYSEDSAYLFWDYGSKFSFDSLLLESCELCYEGVNLLKCYKTFFSVNCELCDEVILSRDCVSCKNCFGCANLKHKSHYIFNRPCEKNEYFVKLKELGLESFQNLQKIKEQAQALWLANPVKYMNGKNNSNVTGNYIYNSKNAIYCNEVKSLEDSKFCQKIEKGPVTRDCYDYSGWGMGAQRIYDSLICGEGVDQLKFCWNVLQTDNNLEYSIICSGSSYLFGCVGLRNKKYCILNKQYSREEYFRLVEKIKKQMDDMPYVDKQGIEYRYGEFFPPELSPSEYNVTVAQEYFPLTKEQALEKGYSWKDPDPLEHKITLAAKDLPDNINDVSDSILQETIGCQHEMKCSDQCSGAFRIIPRELDFYRKMGLPLPRLCPNCRQYQRIKQRNSIRLYKRKCQRPGCSNQFETTYAPGRPEIVYCEDCYLKAINNF